MPATAILQKGPGYRVGILLSGLNGKGLVNRVERGRYELFHPLFGEFITRMVAAVV